VHPATVFHPRTHHDGAQDHFMDDVTRGTVEEMVDSRISVFTEMGFAPEQAVDALKRCNDDVNEALNLLRSEAGCL
jgi:UBA/TS-N domain